MQMAPPAYNPQFYSQPGAAAAVAPYGQAGAVPMYGEQPQQQQPAAPIGFVQPQAPPPPQPQLVAPPPIVVGHMLSAKQQQQQLQLQQQYVYQPQLPPSLYPQSTSGEGMPYS
jgi:hypothetical protein